MTLHIEPVFTRYRPSKQLQAKEFKPVLTVCIQTGKIKVNRMAECWGPHFAKKERG